MKNQEIAQAFERAADILALLDENTFRVLALRKVARAIDEMATPIEQLAAEGGLEAVPGIGKSSAERIREYLRGGRIAEFDDIAAQVPAGVLAIMKIPTVGPKTAALLWKEGDITTVEALLKEIDLGEKSALLKIKGLGAKKLAKMKENLAHLAASSGRIRIGEALPVALELTELLRGLPGVQAVQYCGSLRRGKETIGDIDIAVAAPVDQGPAIARAVTAHPMCGSVIVSGETKTSFRTAAGVQVDVRVVPPESFGAAIQYFTGSKEHNVRLRELAIKKGLKVNEWGVFKTVGGKEEKIAGETEEGVYAALGLAWIPPEMREDHGEIEFAQTVAGSGKGNSDDSELATLVKQVPVDLPSGNAVGDELHRKYRREILKILAAGFAEYLPAVRWVDLDDADERLVAAFEAALVHHFKPPLNRQKVMGPAEAKEIILQQGSQKFLETALAGDDWVDCSDSESRTNIVKSIPSGRKGVYVFRASSTGWTNCNVGYVGKAAKGKSGSSDLRYRLNDHFTDASGADNFVNRFVELFRQNGLGAKGQHVRIYLVELADIRGDLHMHTTASDGTCSIEEMVAEAKRRGYQYIAITDHSKSQIQANGLKADRLLEHIQAIRVAAQEAAKSGMLVLAGTEVDILADGSLDYEDDLLAQLDWVIASPHSALTQETDPATQRLVKAAANPYVCVLGHPTGRLIPSRRGLEPDMAKVIFAAARHGVALELSAHYFRLDLRDIHARMAVEAKVPLCINTDAHVLADFDMMKYGILTARRAWATPSDVLNAWPVEKFKKWLKERKEMAAW